ncbi:MAG: hypothetical protein LBT09_07665 [Planctomycetaceae bacterium]|nr:hypothetical protein [Planctomycetaceae bacterium]
MSKNESLVSEMFANPVSSDERGICCGCCEINHKTDFPSCQSVNLGRGGGIVKTISTVKSSLNPIPQLTNSVSR